MAVTTSAAFLEVLEKSQLLSPEQVEQARNVCESEDDPKAVARKLIKDGLLNKWQALNLLAGRYALTLSKYKLLEQIDADQRERVYLAADSKLGRQVVIKTLSRKHVADNPEFARAFVEHAGKLASLEHRHIVRVYDVDNEDDREFLVMEHVPGQSLQHHLETSGALPVETAVRYVSQAAAGLAYAHQQGHWHGSLQPRSLLIDAHDEIKIANLGVVELSEDEQVAEDPATGAYTAPERRQGNAPIDKALADQYSLGAVIVAALTGATPVGDESPLAKLNEQRPDLSEDLVEIIRRLLAESPADRFSSATEVASQLEAWLNASKTRSPKVEASVAAPPADAAVADDDEEVVEVQEATSDDEASPVVLPDIQAEPRRAGGRGSKSARPASKKGGKSSAEIELPESLLPSKAQSTETPEVIQVARTDSGHRERKPAAQRNVAKQAEAAPSQPDIAAKKEKPDEDNPGVMAIKAPPPRRGKSKKRTKQAKSSDGEASSVTRAGGLSKAYLLGGIVGGVLLLAGVGAGAFLLLRGDSDEVASTQPNDESSTDDVEATTNDTSDAESDPVLAVETDPETDPALSVESDPGLPLASNSLEPTSESNPLTPAGAETDEANASDSIATADDPEATDHSVESSEPSPAVAPVSDPAPTEMEVASAVESDTRPISEPTPEPAVEPKSQPKQPQKAPFADFPGSFVLTKLGAADAMKQQTVGKIYVPDGELCFLKLRGGEQAFRGSFDFLMRNAERGLAERDWEVFLRSGKDGPEEKIAHVKLNENSELLFQWIENSQQPDVCNHFVNCVIYASCAGESEALTLRDSMQVGGMPLAWDKPASKEEWDLEDAPDPEVIRVEIKGAKGVPLNVTSETVIGADDGESWLQLQAAGGAMTFHVQTSMKRRLAITVTPYLKLSDDSKPERWNPRALKSSLQNLQMQTQQLQMNLAGIEQMTKKKGKNEKPDQRVEAQKNLLKMEVDKRKDAITKLEELAATIDRIQDECKLAFRVYAVADSDEVDLLKIGN